jgi:hypothetical protein
MSPDLTDPRVSLHSEVLPESHPRDGHTTVRATVSRYLAGTAGLFAHVILAVGISTVLFAAYLVRAGYSVVPYWDEWDAIINYFRLDRLTWIWVQHNEHRIVFYKLLFLVNMLIFKGNEWPMYIAIFSCQAVSALILGYMLRRLGQVKGTLWECCFGLALYCTFCPSQWENFSWAFQFSFVLVNVWMLTAVLCLLLQRQRIETGEPAGGIFFFVSLLAASAATFTNGNGIVVWPVLVLLAFAARLQWRTVGIYIIASCCIAPLYLIGYHSPPHHANPLISIQQPLSILDYVEKYLGGAVVPGRHLAWAAQIGEAALIVVTVLFAHLLSRRRNAILLDYALAGIILYCLGTVFITSLGRINFGSDQAFVSRYQTFALLFWFSLTTWIVVCVSRQRALKSLLALYLLIAAVTGLSAREYSVILEAVKDRTMRREVGGAALLSGVHDDDVLQGSLFPHPATVWASVNFLRPYRLSLFSIANAGELYRNFASFYKIIAPSACTGYIDAISYPSIDPEAVKLEGWIINVRTRRPLKTLIFVSEGRIVGFGVSGALRSDVAKAIHSNRAARSGWAGYAKLPADERELEVYGVIDRSAERDACLVARVKIPSPNLQRTSELPLPSSRQ